MRAFLLSVILIGYIHAKPTWKLRIASSKFPTQDLQFSTNAYDRDKNIVYAFGRNHLFSIHLDDSRVDSTAWKSHIQLGDKFTLDAKRNRILFGLGGKKGKYAVDLLSGDVTPYSFHREDEESHYAALYWNEKKECLGYFGGYGFYQLRNWAFEYDGNGNWIAVSPNIDNCNPPKRTHSRFILGHPDKPHLYILSGFGSCSGKQLEQTCVNGIAEKNDLGSWCWLRDLFLYDYQQYTFTQIIGPHEESIKMEGVGVYDYHTNSFYIVGGRLPRIEGSNIIDDSFQNKVLKLRIGKDKTFKNFDTNTKGMKQTTWYEQYNYCAYYNPKRKSLIWVRSDGMWELQLK